MTALDTGATVGQHTRHGPHARHGDGSKSGGFVQELAWRLRRRRPSVQLCRPEIVSGGHRSRTQGEKHVRVGRWSRGHEGGYDRGDRVSGGARWRNDRLWRRRYRTGAGHDGACGWRVRIRSDSTEDQEAAGRDVQGANVVVLVPCVAHGFGAPAACRTGRRFGEHRCTLARGRRRGRFIGARAHGTGGAKASPQEPGAMSAASTVLVDTTVASFLHPRNEEPKLAQSTTST